MVRDEEAPQTVVVENISKVLRPRKALRGAELLLLGSLLKPP